MKTEVIPVVLGAHGTVKNGMVEKIQKVSERASVTETQKICMLGSARILRKVLSVWTEWLTWVTDASGAWFMCPADVQKEHQQRLWKKR